MKKRWSAMVLTVSLLGILLAGCWPTEKSNELQVVPKEQENILINLFAPVEGMDIFSASIYRDLISDYNAQNNDLEIRVSGLSTADGYNEALLNRLENKKDVDLFVVNADTVKDLNAKGYFYDLSKQPAFQDLNDNAMQQAMVDGIAYCLPTQMTAYGLYVNVGLLREYGLTPPKTAEEFLSCCRVLKENGITPLGLNRWYAMTVMTMARGLYPIYQAENKEEILAGLNDGSIPISTYMLEGFRFFKELVDQGYYGDGLTADYVDTLKANTTDWENFKSGAVAFAVFTSGKQDDMERYVPDMDYIMQGVPALPDGTVSLPAISTRLCVNAKGSHVDQALTVLDYLTAHERSNLNKGGNGIMPVFRDEEVEHSPKLQAIYDDVSSPGQIPIEDMSLCFDYWGTIRTLCLEIIDGATPEEAAAAYDRIQQEAVAGQSVVTGGELGREGT